MGTRSTFSKCSINGTAPDYRYIKARGTDGGLYILRFDKRQAEWELTMFKSARAQLRKDWHDGRAKRTANCSP